MERCDLSRVVKNGVGKSAFEINPAFVLARMGK
jgi:Mrp family chromosome partitioning ATPase